jgi:hypothetical protein
MIIAIIKIVLLEPVSKEQAVEIFKQSAPNYRDVDGLIHKYYILDEDGKRAGGVYLWTEKEFADRFYSQEWKTLIYQKYGVSPSITYFYSPIMVDNLVGKIVLDPFAS